MSQTPIEEREAWETRDGEKHLSEIAIVLLADAELSLVPKEAIAHAGECASCAALVGEAATLSARVDVAMSHVPLAAPAKHRFPVVLVSFAMAAAVVGFLPRVPGLVSGLVDASVDVPGTLPYAYDATMSVAHALRGSSAFPVVALAGAFVLALFGALIARSARRFQESS